MFQNIKSTSLLTFSLVILTFLVQRITAAPGGVTVNPNLCDNPDQTLMYCNCDDSESAQDVNCFATTNNGTLEASMWDLFRGHPKIQVLKFSAYQGNTLNFFPGKILPSMQKLEKLIISELNFTLLERGSVRGLPVLSDVDFTLCERMSVERDAFVDLPSLKKVSFSNSNLGILVDMFEGVPAIEELFLEENKIAQIENHAFSALSNLKYLFLDKNQIVHISRDTFRGLTQLTELNIIRNKLRYLPPFCFAEAEQLTSLDLAENEISIIDANAFSGLPSLAKINLSKNKLRSFPPGGVFSASPLLAIVDIAFNEFEHLSWQVFYQPEHSRYIRMRIKGNNIQCTCSLFWMSAALKSYDSLVRQELDTIDCSYSDRVTPGDQKLLFSRPEARPRSILDFITNKEVDSQCKLPSALIRAQEEEEKELKPTEEEEEKESEKLSENLPKLPEISHPQPEEEDESSDELDHEDSKSVPKESESNSSADLLSENEEKIRAGSEEEEKHSNDLNSVNSLPNKESEEEKEESERERERQNSLSHASLGGGGGNGSNGRFSFGNFWILIASLLFWFNFGRF